MYNQGIIYNQPSLWGLFGDRSMQQSVVLKRRQGGKIEVKDVKEKIEITSETCSSTSLRRWRTLDMKWIADWQEGDGAGGSALSG